VLTSRTNSAKRRSKKGANGKPIINLSDADAGTWKTVAPNPWPPHNLHIKSWILTGVGATAIKLHKANGGYGLPHPTPLVLSFNIGWDSHIHNIIEKYRDRERISGVLYYISANGKAVGKLTFERAVLASVKWPKMEKVGSKKDKSARITVILQPAHSKVERIEHVAQAPEAPEPDENARHPVKKNNFKLEIEGFNSTDIDAIEGVKLPSIIMDMKRATKFEYDPVAKKQMPHVSYRVTGIKTKHLRVRVPLTSIDAWHQWKHEKARPRVGSIEILQPAEGEGEPQPLYTIKLFGMYINRISKKTSSAEIVISFDKLNLEHHGPE